MIHKKIPVVTTQRDIYLRVCRAWHEFSWSLNQPQVVTAKCSEPQAVDSDVMGEGSGVAILLSVRTET